MNEITLTVSDRAGNVTVTNIAMTLDYTTVTNPPTMQLLWPVVACLSLWLAYQLVVQGSCQVEARRRTRTTGRTRFANAR